MGCAVRIAETAVAEKREKPRTDVAGICRECFTRAEGEEVEPNASDGECTRAMKEDGALWRTVKKECVWGCVMSWGL